MTFLGPFTLSKWLGPIMVSGVAHANGPVKVNTTRVLCQPPPEFCVVPLNLSFGGRGAAHIDLLRYRVVQPPHDTRHVLHHQWPSRKRNATATLIGAAAPMVVLVTTNCSSSSSFALRIAFESTSKR